MTSRPHDRRAPHRATARLTAALLAVVLLAGVSSLAAGESESGPVLRVLAAASLTEVVELLAAHYTGARVEPGFGASSALARQIRDGAPADVFLSASPGWMDFLREAGALSGEPIVLARNRLVCIAPSGGPFATRPIDTPQALLDAIGPDGRVGIADAGVPAGEYARASLAQQGLLDAFRSRLVGQQDVRAVLHAVETGELPAGFVYATDARVADVALLFVLDPATHPPIEYQAALLRNASQPDEARRFLGYLGGAKARDLLIEAGFALP